MTESETHPLLKKPLTKRSFLKLLGAVAIVSRVENEARVLNEGLETGHGRFHFLYESHEYPPNISAFPSDLDFIFEEHANHNLFTAEQISTDSHRPYLDHLLNRNVATLYGDFVPVTNTASQAADNPQILESFKRETLITLSTALIATCAGAGVEIAYTTNRLSAHRRNILQAFCGLTFLWGTFPKATKNAIQSQEYHNTARSRILGRLYGLQSHVHPENAIIFLRNAYMALHLLTTTESRYQLHQKPQRAACVLGAGHAGIEDFLLMGPDFCRAVIAVYARIMPDWFASVIEVNGGLKLFCSSRLIMRNPLGTFTDTYTEDRELSRILGKILADKIYVPN